MQKKLFSQFDNNPKKTAIIDLEKNKKFTYSMINKELKLLSFLNNKKSIIFLIGITIMKQ